MLKKKISFSLIASLPRTTKLFLILINDIILCFFALWLSFSLRLERLIIFNSDLVILGIALSLLLVFFLFLSGSYKSLFKYSGLELIKNIFYSFTFYGLLVFFTLTIIVINGIPRSIGVLHPTILFLLICFSRLQINYLLNLKKKKKFNRKV